MGKERAIIKFEKARWAHNSKAEKWGVRKRAKPEDRELLILGTGRTRTEYFSRLFLSWGHDVQHEKTGGFGTSTHLYHCDHHWYPMLPWTKGAQHVGERMSDFVFRCKLHVVRHPLTCIPSIAAIFSGIEWEFAEETGLIPATDMPKLERIMTYYHALNQRAEQLCDVTMRVEDMKRCLPEALDEFQIPYGAWPALAAVNRGTGYRKSQPTTWSALDDCNRPLSKAIRNMARSYGYEV